MQVSGAVVGPRSRPCWEDGKVACTSFAPWPKTSPSLLEGLVLEPHLFGCRSSLPWSRELGLGVNESSQRARGGCAKSGRPRPHPSPWGDPEVSRPKRPESPLHQVVQGTCLQVCRQTEDRFPHWLLASWRAARFDPRKHRPPRGTAEPLLLSRLPVRVQSALNSAD